MQGFYTTSLLSPNIGLTEGGAMVCSGVPLARTGWMEYLPNELGINSQHKVIKVYRSPEEVFAPASLKSLNGLTVVDSHPPTFISPDTWAAFAKGHGQNIRRGNNGSSDQVLGDLVISDPVLISKVENNTQREVSLGYNYKLYHLKCGKPTVAHEEGEEICTCDDDDGLYEQRQILGNHIAIVTRGRAGSEIAIQDACPPAICCPACESGGCITHQKELSNSSGDAPTVATDKQPIKTERPKLIMSKPKSWRDYLTGLGFQHFAKTSENPEELAEAIQAMRATDSDPGAVARNEQVSAQSLETAERRHLSGNDSTKGKDKMPDISSHPSGCMCDTCQSTEGRTKKTLDRLDQYFSKLEKAGEAEKPPTAMEHTAKDRDGASGEDPDMEKKWKSGMDAFKSDMQDKMATLHDGLSELLKRGKDADPSEKSEIQNLKEGPEEKAEKETAKDKKMKRGKDADMDETGEIPEATDADEEKEEEESDVPPTQHETTGSEAAGEEEWEADNPKEGEDVSLELSPEESLKEGEIPKNPLPKADDSRARGRDSVSVMLLRDHNKDKPFVANPNNFASKKAHDAAIDSWNRKYRMLTGKTAPKATDRSYGDMNKTKKPDNLQAIDGKKVQTQDEMASDYKDVNAAYGEWMRNGMIKGQEPGKAKKSA